MKARDEFVLMVLLALLTHAARGGPAEQRPAPSPAPGSTDVGLAPGWWWTWFLPSEAGAYQAWWARYRTAFAIRKTYGGPSQGATVVLVEVFDRVPWTGLPRRPEPAPRGAETDLTDVAASILNPTSELRKMVETVAEKTWEYLRDLYQGKRPPPEPFPWPGSAP